MSFDLTPPFVDVFGGGGSAVGVTMIVRPVTLKMGGSVMPMPFPTSGVVFYNEPQLEEGLIIGAFWSYWTANPFFDSPWFLLPPGNFGQELLSDLDVLAAPTTFPPFQPISDFQRTDGYYELIRYGRVDWTMTSYRYGDLPVSPVPESEFYGFAGALGLVAFLVRRRATPNLAK